MGVQKAIVAVIGGAIVILNSIWGIDAGIDPATLGPIVNSVAAVLAALGVWAIPNK